VTTIRLEPNISKTAVDAILQQSLITFCCETVRLAILAIAWLLVGLFATSSIYSLGCLSGPAI